MIGALFFVILNTDTDTQLFCLLRIFIIHCAVFLVYYIHIYPNQSQSATGNLIHTFLYSIKIHVCLLDNYQPLQAQAYLFIYYVRTRVHSDWEVCKVPDFVTDWPKECAYLLWFCYFVPRTKEQKYLEQCCFWGISSSIANLIVEPFVGALRLLLHNIYWVWAFLNDHNQHKVCNQFVCKNI